MNAPAASVSLATLDSSWSTCCPEHLSELNSTLKRSIHAAKDIYVHRHSDEVLLVRVAEVLSSQIKSDKIDRNSVWFIRALSLSDNPKYIDLLGPLVTHSWLMKSEVEEATAWIRYNKKRNQVYADVLKIQEEGGSHSGSIFAALLWSNDEALIRVASRMLYDIAFLDDITLSMVADFLDYQLSAPKNSPVTVPDEVNLNLVRTFKFTGDQSFFPLLERLKKQNSGGKLEDYIDETVEAIKAKRYFTETPNTQQLANFFLLALKGEKGERVQALASKFLFGSGIKDTGVWALVNKQIVEALPAPTEGARNISHLIKALPSSGNMEYQSTLRAVMSTTQPKWMKYALLHESEFSIYQHWYQLLSQTRKNNTFGSDEQAILVLAVSSPYAIMKRFASRTLAATAYHDNEGIGAIVDAAVIQYKDNSNVYKTEIMALEHFIPSLKRFGPNTHFHKIREIVDSEAAGPVRSFFKKIR